MNHKLEESKLLFKEEIKSFFLSESLKRLKLLRCAFFMLENRHITVKETSDLFGFESLNHFLISFKKFLGITPGKFKRCTQK